jgi:hypothetical protein
MLQRTSLVAAMITMSLAACGGGGGSDDTAVSANPPAPTAPSPSPSATPEPGAAPAPTATAPTPSAPSASTPPPVTPGVATPPPPAQSPASTPVPSVPGSLVWAALVRGVSDEPNHDGNPYTKYRKVLAGDNFYYLGGALVSHSIGGGFPGASGIGLTGFVAVTPVINGGVITSVTANDLTLEGASLDLRNVNPAINASAGTWTNGQWFATLLVQSVSGQPDLMRVCWNTHLPPPPPVTGPPGFDPLVREAPFKRLMCGVYNNKQAGPDVGGYVIDDFAGKVTTYSASW